MQCVFCSNRTIVCLPSRCGLFRQVRTQQSHSGVTAPKASAKGVLGPLPSELGVSFVRSEKQIQLRVNATAGCDASMPCSLGCSIVPVAYCTAFSHFYLPVNICHALLHYSLYIDLYFSRGICLHFRTTARCEPNVGIISCYKLSQRTLQICALDI